MTVLGTEERQRIINKAMAHRFGELLDWVRPELLHEFGPNDLDEVGFFEVELRKTIEKVTSEFENSTDEAIQAIALGLSEPTKIEKSGWSVLAEKKIEELRRYQPPPIAYGFGHPKYATDFAYWGSMPKLSLIEVSMLSLGADPEAISEETVANLAERHKKGQQLWSAHIGLLRNREFFTDTSKMQSLLGLPRVCDTSSDGLMALASKFTQNFTNGWMRDFLSRCRPKRQ